MFRGEHSGKSRQFFSFFAHATEEMAKKLLLKLVFIIRGKLLWKLKLMKLKKKTPSQHDVYI
jgi:hypothetical protein